MNDMRLATTPACELGESPHWNATAETLSWVDLHVGVLHLQDAEGHRSYSLGGPLSAVRPGRDGLIVVQGNRIGLVRDPETDRSVRHRATVPLGAADRCNDAQIDAWGRVWVGTMSLDHPEASALWVLEPDALEPTLVLAGLTLANGIGWSPQHDRVYVVDTGTRVVHSARLDDLGWPCAEFEALLDLSNCPGVPDGLCVDADGGIWVAMFGAGQLRCFDPSGELRAVVELRLRFPTSAVFSGPLLDELIVTTARKTPKVFDPTPDAGRLISLRPGVAGSR
jgi:sugar lactone lactonase YvrE